MNQGGSMWKNQFENWSFGKRAYHDDMYYLIGKNDVYSAEALGIVMPSNSSISCLTDTSCLNFFHQCECIQQIIDQHLECLVG